MNICKLTCKAFLFTCSLSLLAHTQDTGNYQANQQRGRDVPEFFYNPLEFSQTSITFFLKNVYNHTRYPQYFLALNFLHIGQGLSLAPRHQEPRRFIKKILNLFSMKLQNIYINPYAFVELQDKCITHIAPHCDIAKEKRLQLQEITDYIGSYLTDEFDELKRNPDAKIKELSETVQSLAYRQDEGDLTIRELQHEIHYFFSRGLALLIWSPADQADSWHNMKTIGSLLEKAAEYSLIDIDMLDDLFWVLLQRYALFVQMAAPDLQDSFFDAARASLAAEKPALWTLPERESYITTKQEFLQTRLLEAETVALLRSAGHVVPRFALT
jgi:hypothetical protein